MPAPRGPWIDPGIQPFELLIDPWLAAEEQTSTRTNIGGVVWAGFKSLDQYTPKTAEVGVTDGDPAYLDFPTLCEFGFTGTTAGTIVAGPGPAHTEYSSGQPGTDSTLRLGAGTTYNPGSLFALGYHRYEYVVEQAEITGRAVTLSDYLGGSLPPGAVGVEIDPANDDPTQQVTAWMQTCTLEVAVEVNARDSTDPVTLEIRNDKAVADTSSLYFGSGMPTDAVAHFFTGVELATKPLLGSWLLGFITATHTFSIDMLDVAKWLTGEQSFSLTLGFAEQRTHTAPTMPAMPTVAFASNTSGGSVTILSMRLYGTYHPPRYRFLYDVIPPLRQHPRDDSLGGAPRQGHANQPKSLQGSARQGWRNTYR